MRDLATMGTLTTARKGASQQPGRLAQTQRWRTFDLALTTAARTWPPLVSVRHLTTEHNTARLGALNDLGAGPLVWVANGAVSPIPNGWSRLAASCSASIIRRGSVRTTPPARLLRGIHACR